MSTQTLVIFGIEINPFFGPNTLCFAEILTGKYSQLSTHTDSSVNTDKEFSILQQYVILVCEDRLDD